MGGNVGTVTVGLFIGAQQYQSEIGQSETISFAVARFIQHTSVNEVLYRGVLGWTLRNSSGVGKGIDKSVVQSGRDFPYIRVGGGQ